MATMTKTKRAFPGWAATPPEIKHVMVNLGG
jgi:hypothetical protein